MRNKFKIIYIILVLAVIIITACSEQSDKNLLKIKSQLADKNATDKTAILFHNLKKLTGNYTIFGQQDYASDGHGWKNVLGRCDVKEVTGSYPGVYSFDFLHFTNPPSFETKDTEYLTQLFHETYNRGGIITFCWHYYNPVTGGSFYDTTKVVKHILPGGSHNSVFNKHLEIIGNFAKNAKDENGDLIPFIFRPWHEFDGEWFWWGKPHCTVNEFKKLFRYTVIYLRDSLNVHNLLYAYSPDCRFQTLEEYLERYPGDEYVDLLGFDNYWDFTPHGDGLEGAIRKARIVSEYAQIANKLSALTETGLKNLTDTAWFTTKLLKLLRAEGVNFTYAAVWRGEYVPYPGHPAEKDFINFKNDSLILFEDDLPDIYKTNTN